MDEATSRGGAASTAAGHVRHELRTPLNAVIGYSELLLEDLEELGDPVLVRELTDLRAAGVRLLGAVNATSQPGAPGSGPDHPGLYRDLELPLQEVAVRARRLVELAAEHHWLGEARKIEEAVERFRKLLERLARSGSLASAAPAESPQPVTISPALRELLQRPAPASPAGAPLEGQPAARILVVDDDEMNRQLLASRLAREGHQPTLAGDGQEALELLTLGDFDLVLLDMMMPRLNGYQVLQILKGDERLRHIPVIMLSALDEVDNVVRCIEAGAEDYLAKPFNPVLLRARIGACLEKKRLRDREVHYLQQIEAEKGRADELLHVILPPEIVAELKSTGEARPRLYPHVAVLFCDVVGFTPYCQERTPEEVIAQLQQLVEIYEELTHLHDLQKIKTVGDAFMATAGLLKPVDDPVLASVRCALEMLEVRDRLPSCWEVRIGIHAGPAIAGIVGHRRFSFDLWGDTVNTAARVESHGQEGSVNVSADVWERIRGRCHGHSLGLINVKGKGPMELFRVHSLR